MQSSPKTFGEKKLFFVLSNVMYSIQILLTLSRALLYGKHSITSIKYNLL